MDTCDLCDLASLLYDSVPPLSGVEHHCSKINLIRNLISYVFQQLRSEPMLRWLGVFDCLHAAVWPSGPFFSASAVDFGSAVNATCADSPLPKRNLTATPSCENSSPVPPPSPPVVASCAGFPKDMQNGPSTVLDTGMYGDDACFISRFKNTFVVGVADGVGGWRKYGIDPSEFSRKLMRECEKRVASGDFDPRKPETLLEKAFKATAEAPRPVGSSTACVLVVHQEMLYSANLGDSGFMVVRNGRVIIKSEEQVHYFNAPFQLTLPPEGYRGFIGDTPDLADKSEIRVQKGDIIVLATDGLWDNLN
ncbi:hypothetical protein KIN20_006472 [Parelaphostrongylus tenuis]|uniref:Protein phosphatase n=1 Tax=Parelaphostrongylus tenuis TaxID=148309 RepID=A0AAD5MU67_PARTN|nr:hypothetical protein KIN20_006472 [Parelaphostrongylus tenuis]